MKASEFANKGFDALPTWVYMHQNDDGKTEYNILPLDMEKQTEWQELFGLSEDELNKAIESHERTMEIVGDGLEDVECYLAERHDVG